MLTWIPLAPSLTSFQTPAIPHARRCGLETPKSPPEGCFASDAHRNRSAGDSPICGKRNNPESCADQKDHTILGMSVMWSSRPHPFLLCRPTVNTGSPSTDPTRSMSRGRHFPARVCLMGCLVSLACLVEQTTRPTLHHEHHNHTQSSGERIFPSHARFFAHSDRSSKSDAEHQLRPWSFGITLVPASCRPMSVRESAVVSAFWHFGNRRSSGTGTGFPRPLPRRIQKWSGSN